MTTPELNMFLNLLVFIPITIIGWFIKGLVADLKKVEEKTSVISENSIQLHGKVELYNQEAMANIERIQEVTALQLQQLTKDVSTLTTALQERQHESKIYRR
jgi:hypothetical protein